MLKKVDGTWRMVEPAPVDADQTEVTSLTTNLAGLEINRVIEENAADLAQYGLAQPRVSSRVQGSERRRGRGAHRRPHGDRRTMSTPSRPGEKRVFLVQAFQESVFNKKPFDLRDKRILTIKRDDIDLLEVTTGRDTVQLARTGPNWGVKRPVESRGDYSAIEGLLTRISSASMTRIVEQSPAALPTESLAKYGLDKPLSTITVGAGSSRATLAIGKEENGTVYARDVSRPMVFTIDPDARHRSQEASRRVSQQERVRVPAVQSGEAACRARTQHLRVREGRRERRHPGGQVDAVDQRRRGRRSWTPP